LIETGYYNNDFCALGRKKNKKFYYLSKQSDLLRNKRNMTNQKHTSVHLSPTKSLIV